MVTKAKQQARIPTEVSSRVNYRYLSTPEKVQRLHGLRKKNNQLQHKIRRLQSKLDAMIEVNSTVLDDELSQDVKLVMEENDEMIRDKFPVDSFQYIFWQHQKESLSKKGSKRMESGGIH